MFLIYISLQVVKKIINDLQIEYFIQKSEKLSECILANWVGDDDPHSRFQWGRGCHTFISHRKHNVIRDNMHPAPCWP